MNLKKLSTVIFTAIVFAVFGVVALLNLPEGATRFVVAGLIVAAGVAVYVKSHRDSGEDLL